MRYFDASEVSRLLDYPRLVEALRTAHCEGELPQTHCHVFSDRAAEENKFIIQFAWGAGDAIAIKLHTIFPANSTLNPPLPSIQGPMVLFEAKTGQMLASCDAAELTFRKTAADSALGADFLSRLDARTLLLVGAGGLAPHVMQAMRSVRPSLDRVFVWNRNGAKAQALAEMLTVPSCPVMATSRLDEAVSQADIISCITMATEPLLRGSLLKEGAHVDLTGAYQPQMREADDDVVRRAGRLFVDTRSNCESSGDVADPLASGILTHEQIVADLFDLCKGRHKGRESQSEVTVYKNVGGGHLDMFAIKHLLSVASHIS